MKKDKAILYGCLLLIVVSIVGSFIEFVLEYWYVFGIIVVAAVTLLIWLQPTVSETDSSITYKEILEKPQLPPMPYGVKNFEKNYDESYIDRLLEIYSESRHIVNTSANIETVDSRFGIMKEKGEELVTMPNERLVFFKAAFAQINVEEIFDKALERYLSKQVAEIKNLKTDTGKKKRIEKILSVIDGLPNMPQTSKNYGKKLLGDMLEI